MEPSIVDAVKADNESGPFVLIISESMAIEPEPDIGLISANGSNSSGIPIKDNKGARSDASKAKKPDACSMPIATYIPTMNGVILIIMSKPFLPPAMKLSKSSIRFINPYKGIPRITNANSNDEI